MPKKRCLLIRSAPKRYIEHLQPNTGRCDYVVGDLRGCVDDLHQWLNEIAFDTDVDRLFCVGDLIDRGPSSEEALTLLDHPWF